MHSDSLDKITSRSARQWHISFISRYYQKALSGRSQSPVYHCSPGISHLWILRSFPRLIKHKCYCYKTCNISFPNNIKVVRQSLLTNSDVNLSNLCPLLNHARLYTHSYDIQGSRAKLPGLIAPLPPPDAIPPATMPLPLLHALLCSPSFMPCSTNLQAWLLPACIHGHAPALCHTAVY